MEFYHARRNRFGVACQRQHALPHAQSHVGLGLHQRGRHLRVPVRPQSRLRLAGAGHGAKGCGYQRDRYHHPAAFRRHLLLAGARNHQHRHHAVERNVEFHHARRSGFGVARQRHHQRGHFYHVGLGLHTGRQSIRIPVRYLLHF